MKFTVPVGVPAEEVTVAESVTVSPCSIVSGVPEPTVVVEAGLIVRLIGLEVLVAKFVLPSYRAVMVYGPPAGIGVVVVNDATPLLSVPVPRGVVPLRNVTVPVGVPPAEATLAVNVTG
jgi:hypothetical protein